MNFHSHFDMIPSTKSHAPHCVGNMGPDIFRGEDIPCDNDSRFQNPLTVACRWLDASQNPCRLTTLPMKMTRLAIADHNTKTDTTIEKTEPPTVPTASLVNPLSTRISAWSFNGHEIEKHGYTQALEFRPEEFWNVAHTVLFQ